MSMSVSKLVCQCPFMSIYYPPLDFKEIWDHRFEISQLIQNRGIALFLPGLINNEQKRVDLFTCQR